MKHAWTLTHCHAEMQAMLRMNEEYNKWGQYNSCVVLMYNTRVGIKVLTLSCRWVDISTWTPPPRGCLYLGPCPSVLDNSFFAESLLTSFNFLASLQIIFN